MFGAFIALMFAAVLAIAGGCQSIAGKTAEETVDDASITAAVQSRLTADRMANFTRVDVDTQQGVVNLSGIVPSADQKVRAAEIARQVQGVKRVNNNLQVQKELSSVSEK